MDTAESGTAEGCGQGHRKGVKGKAGAVSLSLGCSGLSRVLLVRRFS